MPKTPDIKVPEVPGNIPGADAAKDLQKKAQDAVDKGKKEADAAEADAAGFSAEPDATVRPRFAIVHECACKSEDEMATTEIE